MADGRKKITFWNRLSYSFSTVPNYMSQFSVSLYLPLFLLEVVQLPPGRVPIVTATCRVLWALAFPLVGYLVNRTNTRWGKLKPWMFVAVFPTAVTYFFTWFSVGTSGETGKLVWFTFFTCAFYVFSAGYGIPQNSLVMFATDEPRERDILNAFAVGGSMLATFAGTLIPSSTLTAFGAPVGYDPCTGNGTNGTAGTNGTHPGASLAVEKEAFMVSAAAIAGIYVLCGLVGVFGVPERKDVKPDSRMKSGLHTKSVIKHLFTFRPFICLLFITGFLNMGGEFLGGNLSLALQYTFGLEDQTAVLLPVATALNALSIFPCYWLLKRFGRKRFLIGCQIIFFLPLCVVLMSITPSMMGSALFPTVFVTFVWGGTSIQAGTLTGMVMATDVIDAFKLKTGEAMETVFYSAILLVGAITSAIAQALSNLLLEAANYNANDCVQPSLVSQYLRYLVTIIPGGCYIVVIIVMLIYPITEETRKNTKNGLDFLKSIQEDVPILQDESVQYIT
ncbi:sodium-dependent lysophosphatidylcholine symporter 1-A-like [Branchiostoma lanceolatum]|uniref:sodium-dependent lysophosphatidylcholine symporter 1-A-like n=1 Tax=Branchiostoma lanceolatum TaxID=7740 RepID=UPI00345530F3